MHYLYEKHVLKTDLDSAWKFFSNPENLGEITPPEIQFKILSILPKQIYPGMIIRYRVKPLLGIPMTWVTEITHVEEKKYFIDVQLSGPYKVWHHEHHFKEVEDGVEMTDILHYSLPMGFLGRILNFLWIGREVRRIFEYRKGKLEEVTE